MEERLARGITVLAPRCGQVELECLRESRQDDFAEIPARLAPRQDHTLEDRDAGVTEHEIGIDLAPSADAVALGARTERRVEGELPRLELREG